MDCDFATTGSVLAPSSGSIPPVSAFVSVVVDAGGGAVVVPDADSSSESLHAAPAAASVAAIRTAASRVPMGASVETPRKESEEGALRLGYARSVISSAVPKPGRLRSEKPPSIEAARSRMFLSPCPAPSRSLSNPEPSSSIVTNR